MDKREITEQVAYVKGLMEGMNFDTQSNEGKIIAALVNLVDDISHELALVNDEIGALGEDVDALMEDMDDLEGFVFDDYDEDEDDEDYDYDEDGMYEITCPACGDTVCLNEDMLSDENLSCPNCGAEFEIGFSDEEDPCAGCKGKDK